MVEKDDRAITIKMIGLHAGVVTALAAAIVTLGQFVFWTRAEGIEMKSIIVQMKEILQRVEAEQARRTGVIAAMTERDANTAQILQSVVEELRDLRRLPAKDR